MEGEGTHPVVVQALLDITEMLIDIRNIVGALAEGSAEPMILKDVELLQAHLEAHAARLQAAGS